MTIARAPVRALAAGGRPPEADRVQHVLLAELLSAPGVTAAAPDGATYAFLRVEGAADSLAFV